MHYRDECGYTVYAYCLMGNHFHILLRTGKETIDATIKRIAGSYAYWFNWKYRRCGHLFQDRFKSEPVEDDVYFLTVLRYIHQNPVKAHICRTAEEYPYSSMAEYLGKSGPVDTDYVMSIITMPEFLEYHKQATDDTCLDIDEKIRLTDDEALQIIRKVSGCKNATEFQSLNIDKRNVFIRKLHDMGMSIRQISRLTGVAKKIVEVHI